VAIVSTPTKKRLLILEILNLGWIEQQCTVGTIPFFKRSKQKNIGTDGVKMFIARL
jgi:hypothetical protein